MKDGSKVTDVGRKKLAWETDDGSTGDPKGEEDVRDVVRGQSEKRND